MENKNMEMLTGMETTSARARMKKRILLAAVLTICMAMMLFSAVLYFIRNGKMLWPRRKGGAHKETAHASN